MTTPRRALTGSAVLVVLVGLLAGCGTSAGSASSREVAQHAEVAATVMARSAGYPVAGNDVAWQVVGAVGDTTIDAVAVDGTAWDGTVTLRIAVKLEGDEWHGEDRTVRCYRYRFDHSASSVPGYQDVDCPTGPPLVLTTPPRPDFSAAGAARLAARLTALPPVRRTAAAIQQVLTALYPPPVASTVTPAAVPGGFDLGVGYTGRCMTGAVPAAGRATVTPQPDLTCRGG